MGPRLCRRPAAVGFDTRRYERYTRGVAFCGWSLTRPRSVQAIALVSRTSATIWEDNSTETCAPHRFSAKKMRQERREQETWKVVSQFDFLELQYYERNSEHQHSR